MEHSQQLPLTLMSHGKTNWCRTFPVRDCAPEITRRPSLQTLSGMWSWWRGGGRCCHAIYMQNKLNTHRKHAQMKRATAYAITQTHSPCNWRKNGLGRGWEKKNPSAVKNQLKVFLCLQGMTFPAPIIHGVGGEAGGGGLGEAVGSWQQ